MYPAILMIVMIGIILGIGLYTLSQTADAVASEAITITDEVIACTNDTSVATADDCSARTFVATHLWNLSDQVVPTTNYTLSTAGVLTMDDSAFEGIATCNLTYTYVGTTRTASTDSCESLSTTSTGLSGVADWIAVIVIVLAAAVVLGIVISSFGKESSA